MRNDASHSTLLTPCCAKRIVSAPAVFRDKGNHHNKRVSLIRSRNGGCGGGVHPRLNPGAVGILK